MTRPSRLLGLAFALSALTAPMGGADARTTQVRFQRGGTAMTYAGAIRGYDEDHYVFSGHAGQTLTVTLSNPRVFAMLFGNGDHARELDGPVTLDRSGRYEVRVMRMRADARRGGSRPYRLTIGIR